MVSVASRNISSASLHGSEPLNSGGPLFLALRCASLAHFAFLVSESSLGLNWNLISYIRSPGFAVPPACGGLWTFSDARCRLFGAGSPEP
jgi:hypothetical protein